MRHATFGFAVAALVAVAADEEPPSGTSSSCAGVVSAFARRSAAFRGGCAGAAWKVIYSSIKDVMHLLIGRGANVWAPT